MSLGLIHDKSSLLKEWLGAIIQQPNITSGITWANVKPDLCRHMVLLSRINHSQAHDSSLLTHLRPRQNGRRFADDMLEYIFLKIDIAFD